MDRARFEELVARAVESLPEEFCDRLENVDVVVAGRPSAAKLAETDTPPGETLLGLYEGVPLTERDHFYGMLVPDKITIYQQPIESICHSDAGIIAEVQRVVRHEIAHHFGISDGRLKQLGMD